MDWKHLRKSPRTSRRSLRWTAFASLAVALLVWWLVSHFAGLPAFILPAPEQVAVRFWKALMDGSLLVHTAATLTEVLLGLLAGTVAAVTLGYAIAKSRLVRTIGLPLPGCDAGHPHRCHCTAAGHLVWTGHLLQGADLCADRLLPGAGQHGGGRAGGTALPFTT